MENVFWFKNLKIIYKGYLLERSRDDYVYCSGKIYGIINIRRKKIKENIRL